MQSVVETPTFLSDAKHAGMTGDERASLVTFVAANPQAGDLIVGTGGARKLRSARPNTGNSAGYRVMTYYAGDTLPVFLMNVFAKGDRANLSKAEQNILRNILSAIADTYRKDRDE